MTERLDSQSPADKEGDGWLVADSLKEPWQLYCAVHREMFPGHRVELSPTVIAEFAERLRTRSAGTASLEYTGYAVVMDDPNSAPEGFWWVGAWHDKATADEIAKKHGVAAHVVPVSSYAQSATERTRDVTYSTKIAPELRNEIIEGCAQAAEAMIFKGTVTSTIEVVAEAIRALKNVPDRKGVDGGGV